MTISQDHSAVFCFFPKVHDCVELTFFSFLINIVNVKKSQTEVFFFNNRVRAETL